MILRLEDTDLERSSEESATGIIEDLLWLGIQFDEGPHVGGDYKPYRQMERLELYTKYAEQLLAEGKAEKDFSHIEGEPKEGDSYAVRFKAGGQKVQLTDEVYGTIEKEIDDFIIMKSNGIPTYHLGVVVDDHSMEITNVIRGKDHLDNTFKHILLYKAFGWTPPKFAHYSLTAGLSKRDMSKSIRTLREKGYLPEAIINIAMLLGWFPKDEVEKFNIFDKLEEFEPKDFNKANSNFDEYKFNWLAGQYIREADLSRLTDLAIPFLEAANYISYDTHIDKEYISKIVSAVRNNIKSLSELTDHIDFFFNNFNIEGKEKELIDQEDSQTVLKAFLEKVKQAEAMDEDKFQPMLKDVQKETGIKGKSLFMPVRVALTGKLHGPDMSSIAHILGKATCVERLEETIVS